VSDASRSVTAVVVSGGKQYRVAAGDRILVDRVAAEPGSELRLDRVLMVAGADGCEVGAPVVQGRVVNARVLSHPRGAKIDVLRYKPKKRVRVRRGARAGHSLLEVLGIEDKAGGGSAARGRAREREKAD
jgi:large subunit ribosomal protein L21